MEMKLLRTMSHDCNRCVTTADAAAAAAFGDGNGDDEITILFPSHFTLTVTRIRLEKDAIDS